MRFVDEPADDTMVTLSVVIDPNIGLNRIDTELAPVAGTSFRSLTLRMRSDLRFSYVFTRRGPTGEDEQVPDPFNPPPSFSECSVARFSGSSVAVLPDAVPLPWLDQAEAQPAPAMPWLHHRYPLSRDPGDVALAGESFGGLCAGWTALHHPTTFGNAILRSPSCGYHSDLTWGSGAAELLRRTPIPTLIADNLAAEPAPIRISHDVGKLERSNTHSRCLDHVLTEKGYDTICREFAGGHDYAWWRGLFAGAVQWRFPPPADTEPPNTEPVPLGRERTRERP